MSPQEIRDAVAASPELQAIAAGRNTTALALALSVGRTVRVLVPIADLQAYLQTNGAWWGIKAASRDQGHIAHQAADVIMDVATARYENVDLSLPLVATQFDALNAAGLLTLHDVDALHAMSRKAAPVDEYDVRCACIADNGDWMV